MSLISKKYSNRRQITDTVFWWKAAQDMEKQRWPETLLLTGDLKLTT